MPEVAEVRDVVVGVDITYDSFLSIPAIPLRWHRQLRLIRFWFILKLCERLIKLLVIAGKQLEHPAVPAPGSLLPELLPHDRFR